jgi:flagellar hook-length control protein FliK
MFVDLKRIGVTTDSQNIAVKLPVGQDGALAETYAEFSDIISALMATTPEQLKHSLENLEWIKVQGDGQGYAPLIDLTAAQDNGRGMVRMLQSEIGPNQLQQIDMTEAVVSDAVDTADQGPNAVAPGAAPVGAGADAQAGMPALAAGSDGHNPQLPFDSSFGKQDSSGASYPTRQDRGVPEHVLKQPQPHLFDPHGPKPPAQKVASKQPAHVQTSIETTGSNDAPPAATQIEASSTKGIRSNASPVSGLSASPHVAAGGDQADQGTGRQFLDLGGGNREAQQLMKNETNDRLSKDPSHDNFRPVMWENTTETSVDTQESLNGQGRATSRIALQPAARMKMGSAMGAENVSGHPETVSQSSDHQTNVIRQIVQRMTLHTQGMQSTMTVRLKPEFLGNVHMQISTGNQQVVVRLATESLAVKEMVEQGLVYLKAELQQHGLEIDKFDVFVAGDKEGSNPGQDLAGFRQTLKERYRDGRAQNSNTSRNQEETAPTVQEEQGRGERQTGEIDYFA